MPISIKNKFYFVIIILTFLSGSSLAKGVSISIDNIQFELADGYIIYSEFSVNNHPKFIKYKEGVQTSSIFIKPISECRKYCLSNYLGEVSDEVNVERLEYNNGKTKASLWLIKDTWSEGGGETFMGLIYNKNVIIQIINDRKLWYSWNKKINKDKHSNL